MRLLAFAALLAFSCATELLCAHSPTGSCDSGGLFGFCSANLKTGTFGCDEDGFCKKKKASLLKIGKGGGCFGNGKCCCNIHSYCNAVFVGQGAEGPGEPMVGTQECFNEDNMAVGHITRKPCRDKFCYSIQYEVRGKINRQHGCETKFWEAIANRDDPDVVDWKGAKLKPCIEIFNETQEASESERRLRRQTEGDETEEEEESENTACIPFNVKNGKGETLSGWQCCCTGEGPRCNQNLHPNKRTVELSSLFASPAPSIAPSIPLILALLLR